MIYTSPVLFSLPKFFSSSSLKKHYSVKMHGLEIGGTFNSGGSIFLSAFLLGLGSQTSNILRLSSFSLAPVILSLLFPPPNLEEEHAASVAAGTMARIVNLHSTFVNREIKAILDQMPTKSYTCATFSRGIIGGKKKNPWPEYRAINWEWRDDALAVSLFRWSWKIFRKYVSIHSSRITIGGES